MSMNRLESLPDDIIEHIYKFEHALKFNDQIAQQIIDPQCRNSDFDTFIWLIFFDSPMTNKEVNDFHLFCIWSNIIIERHGDFEFGDGDIEEIQNNKYIQYFNDFWTDTVKYDPNYFPRDYI